MKRFATALLLLSAATSIWAATPLEVEIDNFDGGVDTAHLSDKLRKSNLTIADNFRSDRKYGLTRREGHTLEVTTMALRTTNEWRYQGPSGTEYLIRLDSSGVIMAGSQIKTGDRQFTVRIATVSPSVTTDAAEGLGKFWFTNRTTGLGSWDETTYAKYPSAPLAARVALYKNRVVLADVSNAQSSVYLSGELNGGDWSTDSRFSTSPVSYPVGGVNDGSKVYDVHTGIDELIIFKALSTSALMGNDQRDFWLRVISPEIGSIYPRTIAQKASRTIFLSNRGLDSYTPPYTFENIGEPVQDKFSALSALTARTRLYMVDTQVQWQQGVSVPTGNISTTFVAGAIGPVNQQHIDTLDADFNAGTVSDISTASIIGTGGNLVFTSTNPSDFANASFEQRDPVFFTTASLHWSVVNSAENLTVHYMTVASQGSEGATGTLGITAIYGVNPAAGYTGIAELQVLDSNFSVLGSTRFQLTAASTWTQYTMDTSALVSYSSLTVRVWLNRFTVGEVTQSTATLNRYIMVSTFVSIFAANYLNGGAATRLDNIRGIALGEYFTSQVFDTDVSSPHYGPANYTVTGGTVNVGVRTSSASNCCWSAFTEFASGVTPISGFSDRYIQYVSSFSTTTGNTISVGSVTLNSWVTGYFQTSGIDVGSNITSWGIFSADQATNGGGITYELQSSTDGTFADSGWTSQSLNSTVGVSVRRYIAARAIFAADTSTDTPSMNSLTVNWVEGETPPDPVGVTFEETYYIFFSTLVGVMATNDKVVALNRNNSIDTYDGLSVGGAVVYDNGLIVGDANPTGYVYSLFTSTDGSDHNRSVQSSFKVRRLDGGVPDALKTFDKIYLTLSRENTDVSQIFKVEYYVDGGTIAYRAENVEISTGTKLATLRSQVPLDGIALTQGHYIELQVTELTQLAYLYNVHRIKLYGTILEVE